MEMKKPVVASAVAGAAAALAFVAYKLVASGSEVSGSQKLTQHQTMKQILKELKAELRQNFGIDTPKEDGLLSKDFFVKMHAIIYKYKKYGQEMISEANFQERIVFIQEAEELKEEAGNNQESAQAVQTQVQELNKKYQEVLKQETGKIEQFNQEIQEVVFDYFNLIPKEYYLSLDKWAQDQGYVKQVKEEYKVIDKEFEDEEANEPVPEGLSKPMAEQLLSEKEKLLQNVFQQLQYRQGQDGVDYEQTVLLNRTMFDDRMYLKTGFTGKDLQRAIMKYGIYEERMKEAKEIERKQQDKIMEALQKYKNDLNKKKEEGAKEQESSKLKL